MGNVVGTTCQNIQDLTVTLTFTQDTASSNGFSVQLNGNSPSGPDAFQQYAFRVNGNSIQGVINNWKDSMTAIVCDQVGLGSTPLSNGIPAGYSLVFQLQYSGSNVSGVVFQVLDNNGKQTASQSFSVDQAGCNCTLPAGFQCVGFQAGDLSPITAFEVVIVGPGNGQGTTFSSGAGSITYTASSGGIAPFSGLDPEPPMCTEVNLGTEETSNVSYGALGACPTQSLTQQFSVTPVTPRLCFTTTGPCTGASIGSAEDQCITIGGVTQCCHPQELYGWQPFITGCSDQTAVNQGCSGPCL